VRDAFCNFQPIIADPDGIGGSQPAFNLITEEQKCGPADLRSVQSLRRRAILNRRTPA
jgi:hypothetical protein